MYNSVLREPGETGSDDDDPPSVPEHMCQSYSKNRPKGMPSTSICSASAGWT